MPRITKVYTRTGDDGGTGLGTGARVPKHSPRIEAYGEVDELNSFVGQAIVAGGQSPLVEPLLRIQNELFHLGSDLCIPEADKTARPVPSIEQRHVVALEDCMDRLSASLKPLDNFILPGGSAFAAALHVCRAVCRRAERRVTELRDLEPVGEWVVPYLNRLSDTFFVMARAANLELAIPDVLWNSRA